MEWQDLLRIEVKPWRILFFCSGNIMRSPYAEYQAKKIQQKQVPDLSFQIIYQSGAVIADNDYIHPLIR